MEQAEIVDSIREAIWLTIQISTPIMLVGLIVGVTVALLQALTQIQEITLVFVPKIIAIFMAIFFLLPSCRTQGQLLDKPTVAVLVEVEPMLEVLCSSYFVCMVAWCANTPQRSIGCCSWGG